MKGKEKTLPETSETAAQPEKKAKKPGKLFIILSYVIALVSLIAALFVPIFKGKMLIQFLLAAFAPLLKLMGAELPASAYGTFFIDAELVLYQWVLILAIVVSLVFSLIMLIPVIVGKAGKGNNLRCAFAAEIVAFIFVLAYVACDLYTYVGVWDNFAMLIPLGVIMLVMAAQSIKYKGWLGTTKFVIFLLALLTLFTLTDIVAVIPALDAPLLSLSGMVGAYNSDVTFMGGNTSGLGGVDFIVNLCQGKAALTTGNVVTLVSEIMFLVISVVAIISIVTDVIGLVAGSKVRRSGEPHTHKGWFIFAAIRYSLLIVLIVVAIVLSIVLQGFNKAGIYMYFTAVVILLTFIVEIIRYCVAKSKLKAYEAYQHELFVNEKLIIKDEKLEETEDAESEKPATTEEYQTNMFGDETAPVAPVTEEVVEEQPTQGEGEQLSIDDAQPVEEPVEEAQPEPTEEVAPAEPVVEEPVVEETVAQPEEEPAPTFGLFDEPVEGEAAEDRPHIDPFINTLTDAERAQFFDVFVNRNKGKIGTIPVYKINGNNSDFFPAVFVHINRVRDLCSDSLLAKIYKEVGKD